MKMAGSSDKFINECGKGIGRITDWRLGEYHFGAQRPLSLLYTLAGMSAY